MGWHPASAPGDLEQGGSCIISSSASKSNSGILEHRNHNQANDVRKQKRREKKKRLQQKKRLDEKNRLKLLAAGHLIPSPASFPPVGGKEDETHTETPIAAGPSPNDKQEVKIRFYKVNQSVPEFPSGIVRGDPIAFNRNDYHHVYDDSFTVDTMVSSTVAFWKRKLMSSWNYWHRGHYLAKTAMKLVYMEKAYKGNTCHVKLAKKWNQEKILVTGLTLYAYMGASKRDPAKTELGARTKKRLQMCENFLSYSVVKENTRAFNKMKKEKKN